MHRVLPANRDGLVRLDPQDSRAHKEQLDFEVRRVTLDLLDLLDVLDPMDRVVSKDRLAQLVELALLECLEIEVSLRCK